MQDSASKTCFPSLWPWNVAFGSLSEGGLPQRLESYILRQLGGQTAFRGTGSFDMKMAMPAEPAESFYSRCLAVVPVFRAWQEEGNSLMLCLLPFLSLSLVASVPELCLSNGLIFMGCSEGRDSSFLEPLKFTNRRQKKPEKKPFLSIKKKMICCRSQALHFPLRGKTKRTILSLIKPRLCFVWTAWDLFICAVQIMQSRTRREEAAATNHTESIKRDILCQGMMAVRMHGSENGG